MTGKPADRNQDRYQIRFAGEGGQGLVLAGIFLAEAAVLEGREVAQSARYGAAVRGGVALADVVIATQPIDFPHVEHPDFLVVMSQGAYDTLAVKQAEGTSILYDTFFIQPQEIRGVEQLAVAATGRAIEEFGQSTGANLIALGALVFTSGLVKEESLIEVVERSTTGPRKKTSLKAISLARQIPPRRGSGPGE